MKVVENVEKTLTPVGAAIYTLKTLTIPRGHNEMPLTAEGVQQDDATEAAEDGEAEVAEPGGKAPDETIGHGLDVAQVRGPKWLCWVRLDLGSALTWLGENQAPNRSGLPVVLSATSLAFMYHEDIVGHNFTMVSAAVYSLCSVSCLWLLRRALLSEELVLAVGKLHVFVDTFKNQWGKRSRQEQCWSFAVWLILVLGFVAGEAYEEWKEMELPDTGYANSRLILKALCTVSFGLSSGILVLVAYVQCHFLLGLDTSLDCWCASLLDEPDFSLGVESWNCLQALLKCIGREMASSFLMMQILGAAGFIYFLTSAVTVAFQRSFDREVMLMEGLRSLPLLLHFLLEMHVFSRGATLTQKCRIIPSFVNQIPSATLLNPARSYLVQFVTDSSAGFLVRDVKLTPEMFLKIFVLIGLLINCPAIFRQPRLGHKRSLVTAGTLNWQSGLAYCHALISDLVLGGGRESGQLDQTQSAYVESSGHGFAKRLAFSARRKCWTFEGLFLVGPVWPRPAAYTSTRRVKSSSLGPRGQLEAEEFRKVLVELTGREGYNAAAVNGKWHFWKVKSGRVAFQRELSLEGAAPEGAVPSLRLFLFYVPQTDTWIISDAPDASGSVVADCGPVLGGTDLQQSWRVWDGDGWKEDLNISVELSVPESMSLSGLCVAPATARPREIQEPRQPLSARGPKRRNRDWT
ncbi:unnamed protein product [Effrenium voratum]|nr:unnamed protein product [Effrenium voratum]